MLSGRTIQTQVAKVTKICARFPEVEVRSRDHYAFLVRGKKFAYYLIDHHGDGRVSLECKAERGVNQGLVGQDANRFFLPPYMAHHGWIGIYMDVGPIDWDEVELFLTDAYRIAAPRTLSRSI